jgi:hypothetical protein
MRIALITGILTAAGPVDAASLKLCLRVRTELSDVGFGEDYWLANDYRNLRGARVEIRADSGSGPVVFDDYLGDGLGSGDPGLSCTTTMNFAWWLPWGSEVNRNYRFLVQSHGNVNSNTVRVYDENVDAYHVIFTYSHTGGEGTFNVDFNPSGISPSGRTVLRALHVSLYSIWRHAGGMTGKTFNIRAGAISGGTRFSPSLPAVLLSTTNSFRKIVTSHELGHYLQWLKSPSAYGPNVSLYRTDCPAVGESDGPGANKHSMGSMEWQSGAFTEGWSHFYAADVWNNHNQSNCKFQYYKDDNPIIDCESPQTGWPNAFMRNMCNNPKIGYGVEIDWLRQLWDVHTNGSSPPSFTAMMNWIASAAGFWGWDNDNVYEVLDDEALSIGGSLWSNWNSTKDVNGVNY